MECRKVKSLLPGLPDDDLHPAELAEVQAHLHTCRRCAEEARELLAVGPLLRRNIAPAAELGTGSTVAARILERETRPSGRVPTFPWTRWAAGAGLATLVVAGVTLRVGSLEPQAQPVSSLMSAPAGDAEALPALVVVDDERTGRQVLLSPSSSMAFAGDRRRNP